MRLSALCDADARKDLVRKDLVRKDLAPFRPGFFPRPCTFLTNAFSFHWLPLIAGGGWLLLRVIDDSVRTARSTTITDSSRRGSNAEEAQGFQRLSLNFSKLKARSEKARNDPIAGALGL